MTHAIIKKTINCVLIHQQTATINMDDDWSPPTDDEMKLIEARRARSDQISKLMSGYLLKGYKMLGSECSICGVNKALRTD